jgi:putative transcriptional regulator
MDDEDFKKLVKSVKQMGAIMRDEDVPHRRTVLSKINVKALRERTSLTQAEFSEMIGVSIRTLQNWEQGRREPEGPAKALLRVVERDPEAVLNALHA